MLLRGIFADCLCHQQFRNCMATMARRLLEMVQVILSRPVTRYVYTPKQWLPLILALAFHIFVGITGRLASLPGLSES